jgi:general secretion pathway protein E
MSPALRKLVTPTTDIAPLRDLASKEGMKPLRISGALKVANGTTTLEEVVRVAPPASQP